MAIKGSIAFEILSHLTGRRERVTINKPASYVNKQEYRNYFSNTGNEKETPDSEEEFDLNQFYESLKEIQAQEPNKQEPDGVVEKFSYRLAVGKWKVEKGQEPMKAHELLGLKDKFSHIDMKKTIRSHQLALHPDKNPQRVAEVEMLFKAFSPLKKEVERDLAARV